MRISLTIFLCLFSATVFCQSTLRKRPYHSFLGGGPVVGESVTKLAIQYSGGVIYGRYFIGIGVGFDQYKFNSVPVFADWRMDIGRRKPLFVYVNAGPNFPGSYTFPDQQEFLKISDKLKTGFYMDGGIGGRVRLSDTHRLFFSAGYSQKKLIRQKKYSSGFDSPSIYKLKYTFDRVIFKVGWEF